MAPMEFYGKSKNVKNVIYHFYILVTGLTKAQKWFTRQDFALIKCLIRGYGQLTNDKQKSLPKTATISF